MKSYTVSEISKMLKTNPETVRRWIRSGKLKASQTSRKSGNLVLETDLNSFLETMPKYATTISTLAGPGLSFLTGAALSTLILVLLHDQGRKKKDEQSDVTEENLIDVISYLNEQIEAHKNSIAKKRESIADIEEEIDAEEKEIVSLQESVREISKTYSDGGWEKWEKAI